MSLRERIEAVIDRKQTIAEAATAESPGDWRWQHYSPTSYVVEAWDGAPEDEIMTTGSIADAEYIATNDPDSVLAGIAEDRRQFDEHEPCEPGECIEEHGGVVMCHHCDRPAADCFGMSSLARRHGVTP